MVRLMQTNHNQLVTTVTFDFGTVEKTLDAEDVATAIVRILDENQTIAPVGGCTFYNSGHDIVIGGGGSEVARLSFEDARELVAEHSYRSLEE